MSNLSARLTARKMPHKDVQICLDLNLLDHRERAMKAIPASRTKAMDDERLASPRPNAAVRELELVEQQIRDASITIRIYGVDRHEYNAWVVACPPRKGRQEPFNGATFYMHAAKNSAVYVDEDGVEHEITPEEWAQIDKMTDGEHDRLAQAVLHVNRGAGAVDVGFFGNVSGMIRDSSETSDSRSESESRLAGSGAGNRKKSTSKTSTKKDAAE